MARRGRLESITSSGFHILESGMERVAVLYGNDVAVVAVLALGYLAYFAFDAVAPEERN